MLVSEGLNRFEGRFPPNPFRMEENNEVPLLWHPRTNHTTGGNTESP